MKELDKRIAELRGDKTGLCQDTFLNEYYDGWICDCGYKGNWSDDKGQDEHDIPVKPYSTDIRYAFELWDEGWDAGLDMTLFVNTERKYTCETMVKYPDKFVHGDGDTASEAIANWFVVWRENEHCKR